MRAVFGSDHGGFEMKRELMEHAKALGCQVSDVGCYSAESADYPDYALKAAGALLRGEADRAVLICGTGIGVSISANKVRGIRCALCGDVTSARLTREHNDTNALALGARIIGIELAKDILAVWLRTDFVGGYHARRVRKVTQIELLAPEDIIKTDIELGDTAR